MNPTDTDSINYFEINNPTEYNLLAQEINNIISFLCPYYSSTAINLDMIEYETKVSTINKTHGSIFLGILKQRVGKENKLSYLRENMSHIKNMLAKDYSIGLNRYCKKMTTFKDWFLAKKNVNDDFSECIFNILDDIFYLYDQYIPNSYRGSTTLPLERSKEKLSQFFNYIININNVSIWNNINMFSVNNIFMFSKEIKKIEKRMNDIQLHSITYK